MHMQFIDGGHQQTHTCILTLVYTYSRRLHVSASFVAIITDWQDSCWCFYCMCLHTHITYSINEQVIDQVSLWRRSVGPII